MKQRELSTDGGNYSGALFTPNGNGVISARDKSLEYIPVSGGLPKTIWDKSAFLWDLSPDGNTLLFYTTADLNKPRFGVVRQLDLASGSTKTLLDDPELETWCAHFSHDGRWVVFNATKDLRSSHIYVVPFRKALVQRNEWIAITNGNSDDKPRFSFDDKLIFFVSGHAAPYRIWAQRLGSDMHPDGKPFAVYPGQGESSAAISGDPNPMNGSTDILVGPNLIVFTHDQATGNIWLLELAKKDAH
jgi:WD40 repeat protein